jgi:hypothetical protein
VPIFYPIALSLGIDMQWFAILMWEGDWVENWHDNEWNLYKINKKSKDEDNPHRDEDKTHLFGDETQP